MVAKFPGLPIAHGQLIRALLSAGRTASADSALLAARRQLSTPVARGSLLIGRPAPYPPGVAWRYAEAGRLERARELLREAAALLPEPNPDVLYAKGWLALLGGELGEAERQLRRSSDASPATSLRRSRANVALAASQLARGDAERAERTLRADAESRVRSVPRDRMLGWALAAEERFAEAGSVAETVLKRDPGPESHRLLAWVLVAGDHEIERGMELAQEALEMPADAWEPAGRLPFAAPFEHTIGLAALKLGRYDEAVEHLEHAAAAYPDRELIRTHLAEARERRMRSQG
jgi:tetratricopeptide (TPR) repeat protein